MAERVQRRSDPTSRADADHLNSEFNRLMERLEASIQDLAGELPLKAGSPSDEDPS